MSSPPLAFVYGDCLTKHLSKDFNDVNLSEVKYRVFVRPGAHIASLSNFILNHEVSEAPDFVLLHVGTNSISYCGLLTRFLRHLIQLLDCVEYKFPNAVIVVSEFLVRSDLDVQRYNIELGNLCKCRNIRVVRSSVTVQDLACISCSMGVSYLLETYTRQ